MGGLFVDRPSSQSLMLRCSSENCRQDLSVLSPSFPLSSCAALFNNFDLNSDSTQIALIMASQLFISQCYDSFGLHRENDIPCDPTAEVSACCGTDGSQCVDNLHCINPAGGSVSGTCTYSGWVSGTEPSCPCPPIYVCLCNLAYSLPLAVMTLSAI
jgi:hypothetical protein